MHEPPRYPGRIRTDATNAFAHHTLAVRVPVILRAVLERNPDYSSDVRDAVQALAEALAAGAPLPPLAGDAAGAADFRAALSTRTGQGWLSTDWLCAETYAYRQLIERTHFWQTGQDPFFSNKHEEYGSLAHAAVLERALTGDSSPEQRLHDLFGDALFGNRIDLSFAASRERGLVVDADDFLVDEREAAVRAVLGGQGSVHVIADNAGTELTLDLVLVDFLLADLRVPVVVHVKTHPTFVSDATAADVRGFLGVAPSVTASSSTGLALSDGPVATNAWATRLRDALEDGRLELAEHPFWTGPESLWSMPRELAARFRGARLVVLKGDANYRRAVGDAVWPVATPFADVTAYFPAPLLALRTLKSDPIVGVTASRAERLDREDPTWRVNGKRGVACIGGDARRGTAVSR